MNLPRTAAVGAIDDGSPLAQGGGFQFPPDLIRLHVVADAVIALAYFVILAALVWFIRQRRTPPPSGWALGLFAAFIVVGGISHLLDIAAIWKPLYYLRGCEKALAAIVSMAAAISIIPLLPRLLSLRSPEELAEARQRLREEIAARELAEEDLRRSRADTQRAVLELDQYAYITSHDLQAPLRTISGFSQLLTRRYRPKLEGDALEFLDYIEQGCRQMQAQIRALLGLSRVGRGGPPSFERRPLGETVTRAIRSRQEAIDRSGAEIVSGVLPEVEANHDLFVQLLQHLIDNAIKFHRPGQKPHIRIAIDRLDDEWELVVADQGIGIPPEQLENVFAIFRRLHGASDCEGTGIGLAICRKIAHCHGGEITATADETGTQFHVRLPVSPSAQRRPVLTGNEDPRRLGGG
ncbi:MAG: hypothetical protein NVS9B10_04200 [Nevskia sp.]